MAPPLARRRCSSTVVHRCCSSRRWAWVSASWSTRTLVVSTASTYLVFVTPGLHGGDRDDAGGGGNRCGRCSAGVKWMRTYHAAVATPIERGRAVRWARAVDVPARVVLSSTVFLIVAVVLGGVPSCVGRAGDPGRGAGRVGVRGGARTAYAVTQESDIPFAVIMRVGLFPMFLFSGTFFPTSRLPGVAAARVLAVAAVAHGRVVPRRDDRFGAVGRHRARARDLPRRRASRPAAGGASAASPGC